MITGKGGRPSKIPGRCGFGGEFSREEPRNAGCAGIRVGWCFGLPTMPVGGPSRADIAARSREASWLFLIDGSRHNWLG